MHALCNCLQDYVYNQKMRKKRERKERRMVLTVMRKGWGRGGHVGGGGSHIPPSLGFYVSEKERKWEGHDSIQRHENWIDMPLAQRHGHIPRSRGSNYRGLLARLSHQPRSLVDSPLLSYGLTYYSLSLYSPPWRRWMKLSKVIHRLCLDRLKMRIFDIFYPNYELIHTPFTDHIKICLQDFLVVEQIRNCICQLSNIVWRGPHGGEWVGELRRKMAKKAESYPLEAQKHWASPKLQIGRGPVQGLKWKSRVPQLSGPCSCQPHTPISTTIHSNAMSLSLSLSGADSKTRNSETRVQINGAPLKCQSHLPFRAFTLPSHAALSSSLPLLPLCPTNSPETNGRRRLIRELGLLISIKTRFSLPSLTSFLVPFHFEVILYEIVKMWK